MLDVVFDPEKDAVNRTRHGVSLRMANQFDLSGALKRPDDREWYGEERINATGRLGRQLYVLTYTERGAKIRAISLRRANKSEREAFLASKG